MILSGLGPILAFAACVAAQGQPKGRSGEPPKNPQHWLHGPTWGVRTYRGGKAYITSVDTTLIPGEPPNPAKARLAIWPGMDMREGSLLQPIIVSSDDKMYQGS
jgi:hypothetical protein